MTVFAKTEITDEKVTMAWTGEWSVHVTFSNVESQNNTDV